MDSENKEKRLYSTPKSYCFSAFVDELVALSDSGEFEKGLYKIYFLEVLIEKGNISPFEASFLHLDIEFQIGNLGLIFMINVTLSYFLLFEFYTCQVMCRLRYFMLLQQDHY